MSNSVDFNKNRKLNIEIIRIIACFIVICLHTSSWYIDAGSLLKNELLIKCFLQDAVPLFWYIMGFFLFSRDKDFWRLFLGKFKSIFVPAFIVMVLFQILSPWLMSDGSISILGCICNPYIDFDNLFGGIIQWKASMTLGGHLWYIFSYMKVIMWYPLLSVICKNDDKSTRIRRYLLALSIIAVFINDIQQFYVLPIGKAIPYSILDNSLTYVVLGYELSYYRKELDDCKTKNVICFAIIFIIANLIRFALNYIILIKNINNDYYLHINNIVSFVSSTSLFLSLYILFKQVTFNNLHERIILKLSGCTFGIYLIHRGIYEKLNVIGIRKIIYSIGDNFFCDILAMIVYAGIVFIISLLICLLFFRVKLIVMTYILRIKRLVFSDQ